MIAAAHKKKREYQEEEDMTRYSAEDLAQWEFKIVRSSTGKFQDPHFLRRVCEEESESGWELLEKFDNNRIRFKRPVERRSLDALESRDPYRTSVGMSEGQLVLTVIFVASTVAALIVLLVRTLS